MITTESYRDRVLSAEGSIAAPALGVRTGEIPSCDVSPVAWSEVLLDFTSYLGQVFLFFFFFFFFFLGG